MKIFQKYQSQQKRKIIGMLKELIKKLESGELVVNGYGFWSSKMDNRVFFRIEVISHDAEKEIKRFSRFS